ncbi:Ankyrin repeat family protein [Abeliophyllum distichum]|uniref:Ankyrin repeat family protein n=1 Tax=Abeliophyllum distichum TaxID=126358 RepID=A0ABD1VR39_9LAMI
MASISSSSAPKYPYPSEVNVGDFVYIKLSQTNYIMWSKLMVNYIKKEGLYGFIDGTLQAPSMDTSLSDFEDWKKSDSLVKGWILSTLEDDVLRHVAYFKTAEQVWSVLKKMFGHPFIDFPETELNDEAGKNLSRYLPLHKAALSGDWEKAKSFIEREEPQAFRAIITGFSETALIVSARSVQRNYFSKKLVELMSPEDLAIKGRLGLTALHVAAAVGNAELTKLLVDKNPDLPNIRDNADFLALHLAAGNVQRNTVTYLLTVTKEDVEPKPFEDKSGVDLIHFLLLSDFYDIALSLLHRFPKLASGDPCPLLALAVNRSAFPSGARIKFWQRFIGHLPQVKLISDKTLIYHQAVDLVKYICLEVLKLDLPKAITSIGLPLRIATQLGTHEVVEEILEIFPSAIFLRSNKNESVFHLAILYRQAKVYNLVYQFEDCTHMVLVTPDILMNNGLHCAARVEDHQRLNLRATAPGAALQMQRELQWFKEVEKFMLPRDKQQKNTEGRTPGMVFTETHAELIKEGEQWMKDKANSCMFVAALIAAVVFAAAITVPGGNNQDNGLPIFSIQNAFGIFAISDALCLFCSVSSILMFLSILTSRYAADDFLFALPNRLIIGLATLFFAIVSMIIAFCSSFYLVFGNNKDWILIPLICVACLSIILFVSLQFKLLFIMIKSTYFPGLFGRQSDRIFF